MKCKALRGKTTGKFLSYTIWGGGVITQNNIPELFSDEEAEEQLRELSEPGKENEWEIVTVSVTVVEKKKEK